MPVSGPMAGSGRWRWPLPLGSGCTRKVARPSSSARMKSRPALGLLPGLHHHVFQLFVEELFGRLFELRVHFHVVGQHAQRLEVCGLALFERREQALHRFGGVGAMRQHLFERFLARADLRDLGLQRVDLAAQFRGGAAALGQLLLGAAALAGDRFQLQLALRPGFRKAACGRASSRSISAAARPAPRAWSAPSRARCPPGILRSARAGSSAWRPRPAGAEPTGGPASMAFSRSRTLACSASRCWLISCMRSRDWADLRFQRRRGSSGARRFPASSASEAHAPAPAIPSRPGRCAARWRRSP